MDERTIFVTDKDGVERKMEIFFTFDSEQYGKSYVFFFDPNDPDGQTFCMSYDEQGNLEEVTSEEEWEMITETFEAVADEEEK